MTPTEKLDICLFFFGAFVTLVLMMVGSSNKKFSPYLVLFLAIVGLFIWLGSRATSSISTPTQATIESQTTSSHSSYDKSECKPGGACLSPEEVKAMICAVVIKDPSHAYYQDCKRQGY